MPFFWQALAIIATSFIGSALTASLGIGGGLLLIAVISTLAPTPAVIPVHGAIMVGSNASRAGLLFQQIDRHIIFWFAVGAGFGALAGAQIVTSLPATLVRGSIAGFILFSQWGPQIKTVGLGPRAYALAGALSTFLTLFVGASGPFMTSVIAKASHLTRQGLIATAGACMTLQHSLKVMVFILAGFAYAPWLPLIIAALASGFCGTFLGTRLLQNMPEKLFRTVLKWLLTVLAIYLLVLAWQG